MSFSSSRFDHVQQVERSRIVSGVRIKERVVEVWLQLFSDLDEVAASVRRDQSVEKLPEVLQ